MILYLYQHNLQGTNLCAFTQYNIVCNPSYKCVAIFKIKTDKLKFIKESDNRNSVKFKQITK